MRSTKHHQTAYLWDDTPLMKRYFFKFFKSKKEAPQREGVIPPDELKKMVIEIGRGKKVNIIRMAYDGTPEDPAVSVKIIDIGNDQFNVFEFHYFHLLCIQKYCSGQRRIIPSIARLNSSV